MGSSQLAPVPPTTQPFDAVAAGYDASFTHQRLGSWLREIVWERMADAFEPGQHVLELGCGTGEDALWLARHGVQVTATDVSAEMLAVTRRKRDAAGLMEQIDVRALDLNDLAEAGSDLATASFDGVVSNFGPVNCVRDRAALWSLLARVVRPGGRIVLVVMGPVCPWEMVWLAGHGHPRAAMRRFRAGAPARVGGSEIRVWYPSQRRVRRELAPAFRTLDVAGVGLLLPPSEHGALVERAPRLAGRLAQVDKRNAGRLPWRWLNDHYVLVMERR